MRFTKMAVLMSAVLALPATALAQNQGQQQPDQQQQQPPQQQPPQQQPPQQQPPPQQQEQQSQAKLGQQDRQIMGRIHHMNQLEIQEAKLAQKRGQSSQVKSFAKTVVTDHQQLDQKITMLAKQHKVKVPKKMKAETAEQKQEMKNQKQTLANLKKLKGQQFDQAFLTAMAAQHQKAINYLQQAQGQVQNQELKTAIGNALPVLMKHRAMAQRLQQPTPSS